MNQVRPVANPGDGLCFYYAIAQALDTPVEVVREHMADAVRTKVNPELVKDYLELVQSAQGGDIGLSVTNISTKEELAYAIQNSNIFVDEFIVHNVFPQAFPKLAILLITRNHKCVINFHSGRTKAVVVIGLEFEHYFLYEFSVGDRFQRIFQNEEALFSRLVKGG